MASLIGCTKPLTRIHLPSEGGLDPAAQKYKSQTNPAHFYSMVRHQLYRSTSAFSEKSSTNMQNSIKIWHLTKYCRKDTSLRLLTSTLHWEDEKLDWRWRQFKSSFWMASKRSLCEWVKVLSVKLMFGELKFGLNSNTSRFPRSMVTLKNFPRASWWKFWRVWRRTRKMRKTCWKRFSENKKDKNLTKIPGSGLSTV